MDRKIKVARCHEIQLAIKDKEVARFETIPEMGMAVQLSLHIRGLPIVSYEVLKLVATSLIGIPRLAVDRIVYLLGDIEFVKIVRDGKTIKSVLPTVPYFDELYDRLGQYLEDESGVDEFEHLTLEIVHRLAASPHNIDSLAGKLGAERKAFEDSIKIGCDGNFLISRRSRSKNILMNPTYFSENAEVFADHVANVGASSVKQTLEMLQAAQGWPLALIEQQALIGDRTIGPDSILLLKRLAQDGIVKPPSISTSHVGTNHFMFTPTPGYVNLSPLKREQYERALAIVSAVRQGQLLPNTYRIRSPGAVLYKLKTELQLAPTTDYSEQYQNLQHLRIARLEDVGRGFRQLKIIDTPENRESLNIAYNLVQGGASPNLAVDEEAAAAMTGSRDYVESLIGSRIMREKEVIKLSDESEHEVTQLLLEGF